MDSQHAIRPDSSEIGTSEPVSASTGAESAQSRGRGLDSKQGDHPTLGSHRPGSASVDTPQSSSSTAEVHNEEVRPAREGSISRRVASVANLERVEPSPVQTKESSAVLEVGANADPLCRAVRITHAPGRAEQLKVHGSRRVLEILLLTWRSGVQLQGLSGHIQGSEGSVVSMDVSIRVPIGRLIVGSVLTARYERDPGGHPAEINASLVQNLLESPQGSEANCNKCDPLRNARIFVQGSGENVPMLMNLHMQLRAYPIGTTCEEALTELQLESRPIVGLCCAFARWVPIPKQFRMQPSWCTIVWPVPRPDRNP